MVGTWAGGGQKEVAALTASVTLTNNDIGKVFTNRGAAGAVTVTLMSPDSTNAGGMIIFNVVANQTLTILCTGKVALINDATGNSISVETTNEKIGAVVAVISDGTTWFPCNLSVGANTITTAT